MRVWWCLYVCRLYESVTVQLHVCSTPECTFQRQDSSWACWTFACYQELRVKWRELIFCLLEVHSLGLGRSLAHSLGCHAEGSLSHPPPPPPPPQLLCPPRRSLLLMRGLDGAPWPRSRKRMSPRGDGERWSDRARPCRPKQKLTLWIRPGSGQVGCRRCAPWAGPRRRRAHGSSEPLFPRRMAHRRSVWAYQDVALQTRLRMCKTHTISGVKPVFKDWGAIKRGNVQLTIPDASIRYCLHAQISFKWLREWVLI